MTTWVTPELTVTVPALKLPPDTLVTVELANTGSWMNTGPPGRTPDRVTVMTRPAPGLVTASATPYVVRAPVSTSYDDVALVTAIVWPAAIHALGMPRPT